DLFGRVAEVSPSRIEVDLDVSQDLAGWGGAPVLSQATGKVIGILQAFYPQGSTARVSVSPIAAVRAALTQPLENGVGKPFSAFEKLVAANSAKAPAPAAGSGAPRVVGHAEPERGREGEVRHASTTPPGPLIPGQDPGPTRVHVEIDVPSNGAVVGDAPCRLYVAGRALALRGELRQCDVMIVLDPPASTADGTGADINGNGIVGKPALGGGLGQIFGVASTDPGDSILAAEVAAARQIMHGLDPRTTRLGVITFAGEQPGGGGGLFSRGVPPAAGTLAPPTNADRRIEPPHDHTHP